MNSDTRTRIKRKICVENVHALDIRKISLRKEGILLMRSNRWPTIYRYGEGVLYIDSHDQSVRIEATSCHFGGHRYWFLCPECSKRIAVIYELNGQYLCRHCHSLPYLSQQVAEDERLRFKARKIRDRLGATHNLFVPITTRPKGMHWNTYYRLRYAEVYANYRSVISMAKALKLDVKDETDINRARG